MSLRKLPEIKAFRRPEGMESLPTLGAMDRWKAELTFAASSDDVVIDMLEVIGEDYWSGGGVTAADVSRQLTGANGKAVTVNLNSPGGDYFEGAAIFSLLKMHPAKVTVNVLGLAASAASLIAMAADEIRIGEAAMFMIHNAWTIALGDRHDMTDAAGVLAEIDGALRDVYAWHTGQDSGTIEAMMDDETWINAVDAVAKGFADSVLAKNSIAAGRAKNTAAPMQAQRRMDTVLAHHGITKSERSRLFAEIKTGTSRAADLPAMSRAGLRGVADDLKITFAKTEII